MFYEAIHSNILEIYPFQLLTSIDLHKILTHLDPQRDIEIIKSYALGHICNPILKNKTFLAQMLVDKK